VPIKIHGKEYKTVVERVTEIHNKYPGRVSITTKLVEWTDDGRVVMKASVTIHGETRDLAPVGFTGYAYEMQNNSQINKTSALENCETSAIGRALAAAGFAGHEYASANEMENAVHQQKEEKPKKKQVGTGGMTPATKKKLEALINKAPFDRDTFKSALKLSSMNDIDQERAGNIIDKWDTDGGVLDSVGRWLDRQTAEDNGIPEE